MRTGGRWVHVADKILLTLLALWLVALPLPFGGVIDAARPLIIACPIVLAACAATVRSVMLRERSVVGAATASYRWFTLAALVYLSAVALQLLPLPHALVRIISPEAARIWAGAHEVASLAGVAHMPAWRLSVDPAATTVEFFRIVGLLAAFQCAAMLVRDHQRRMLLVPVLAVSTAFQVLYGVREAALGTYAIWGWRNTKIYDRVTGTFVNPNHYAHYLAIAVPLIVFAVAALVRDAVPRHDAPWKERIAVALSHHAMQIGLLVIAAIGCLAGILLAQSRGALFSLAAGTALVAAVTHARTSATHVRAATSAFIVLGAVLLTALGLVLFLGRERTVDRFRPSDTETATLGGRRVGISAGLAVMRAFPVAGSGAGTFESVVTMAPAVHPEVIYQHVHNDFVETAATLGIGAALLVGLFGAAGIRSLGSLAWGAESEQLRWRRRALTVAALGSIAIAMLHAMIDFNFYIPANPATLAVIVGAAVAPLTHDRRTRRAV